jgi:ribonuclease P protein component
MAEGKGRVGITVSRRVGNAVTRNRVRRWVREFVRQNAVVPADTDVVFIARSQAARLTGYAEVERDLLRLQEKVQGG